ncbi:MAG TPA: hypothetical protein VK348_08490, partial [Planctomycetota bacterium]|nr:hypothetical protein [Planctomycetota bacterium]
DLADGFAFRIDLLLEQRTAATVLKLGGGLEVQLDGDGRARARLVQRGPNGRGGTVLTIDDREPLPLHRWCTLEIAHDGTDFWCRVDDRLPTSMPCKEPVLQTRDDVLELSLGDQPVPGAVDEVQWFVYSFGESQPLPAGVEPERAYRIVFGADGEPMAAPEIVLQLRQEQRSETFIVKRSGVIE